MNISAYEQVSIMREIQKKHLVGSIQAKPYKVVYFSFD
jgi:hypothetical protein